jgi:hypothetical protein
VQCHFECIVDRSAQEKDKSNTQTNTRLQAPVERRQENKKKIFAPKERESLHGCFQPTAQVLKENIPGNPNVQDGFHGVTP